MASNATAPAPPSAKAEPKHPVDSIAGQIVHLSSGDRAGLRRIYLTKRHEADGVVVTLLHRARVAVPEDPARFAAWRLLAHCAALLVGTGRNQPHAKGRRLGAVLHEAGLSENRLLRLTAARGAGLEAQVIRAVRMIAQRGKGPVNLRTLRRLIGTDPDKAEAARIRIARDYYAAQAQTNRKDAE